MPKGPQLVQLMPIRDMGRAIKFYTKSIGFKLAMRGEGEMGDGWASLTLGSAEFWLIAPNLFAVLQQRLRPHRAGASLPP